MIEITPQINSVKENAIREFSWSRVMILVLTTVPLNRRYPKFGIMLHSDFKLRINRIGFLFH